MTMFTRLFYSSTSSKPADPVAISLELPILHLAILLDGTATDIVLCFHAAKDT
jgi:hypothetical protein